MKVVSRCISCITEVIWSLGTKLSRLPCRMNFLIDRMNSNPTHATRRSVCEGEKYLLQARGSRFTFMKGFTLSPDFCPSIYLRHQADIDVHISPFSVACARHALIQSGYVLELEHPSGELRFVSSLHESRKQGHRIYGVPRFSRVEFHQKMWEERQFISLQPPEQVVWDRKKRSLMGIQYPGFSKASMLVLQLLHAFRHLLSSWIRQSWLYEISYFLNNNREDDDFWKEFVDSVSEDQSTSDACVTILLLCSLLVNVRLPESRPVPYSEAAAADSRMGATVRRAVCVIRYAWNEVGSYDSYVVSSRSQRAFASTSLTFAVVANALKCH